MVAVFNGVPDYFEPHNARSVDAREVATLVRLILRKAYPEVRFSVRISRFARGTGIEIRWKDGPLQRQVEALTSGCWNHCDNLNLIAGEFVRITTHIVCYRSLSEEIVDRMLARIGINEAFWPTMMLGMLYPAPLCTIVASNDPGEVARAIVWHCDGAAWAGREERVRDIAAVKYTPKRKPV